MTEDTKRAMDLIRPIARELGITAEADKDFLYLNGQAIGIGCNSTWATVNEFIAYAFCKVWAKDKCQVVRGELLERIKRYWYSSEQLQQFRKAREWNERHSKPAGN